MGRPSVRKRRRSERRTKVDADQVIDQTLALIDRAEWSVAGQIVDRLLRCLQERQEQREHATAVAAQAIRRAERERVSSPPKPALRIAANIAKLPELLRKN